MKILMLGWELPPHNSGGLGVACFEMSKALAIKGAEIDFVVPYQAEHPEAHFMKIYGATTLSPLHRHGMGAYESGASAGTRPSSAAELTIRDVQKRYTEYVETHLDGTRDYDAIHAHDWLTMEAGVRAKELTGLPLVVHVHATEFDRSASSQGNPIVHEIEQQGLMMADRIIAVSQLTKNLIIQRYGIPAENIEVVYNAIDVNALMDYSYDSSTYRYLEDMKRHGYTIVATVTRFTVQKGLTQLMQAAARATDKYDKMLFLFAGDGEQREELLRLSAQLGIADKVFFTGFVRGKQWRDAYSVADIFVMSSVSEPFGISALEAAHHSNAIILTNQSGVSEVLRSVFTYDFWDTDALADRLVALAHSDALRRTMVQNITQEYARISWHHVAEQCVSLYKRIGQGVMS